MPSAHYSCGNKLDVVLCQQDHQMDQRWLLPALPRQHGGPHLQPQFTLPWTPEMRVLQCCCMHSITLGTPTSKKQPVKPGPSWTLKFPLTPPLAHLIAALHRVCPTPVVGPWVLDTSQTSPSSLFLCLSCPPLRLSQILPPWGSCLQTSHSPGLPWRPWCPSTTRQLPGVHGSLSFV